MSQITAPNAPTTGSIRKIASVPSAGQAKHEWLTAEDLAKVFHTSSERVKEALYHLGYACRDSKKPTETAFRIKMARKFHAHGRDLYKWNRKMVLPELKEFLTA